MDGSSPIFTMRRMVQFAETDLAGVLHFANYYRMMEEVEHAFWRSLGSGVVISEGESHISWPRVATSCEYFAPAHFEDELELRFTVAHVGQRSVTYQTEFIRQDERIALGKTIAVCCAMKEGAFGPIAIPDDLRSKLITSMTAAPPS
jgi:acyl-CoA thioester hydrolase